MKVKFIGPCCQKKRTSCDMGTCMIGKCCVNDAYGLPILLVKSFEVTKEVVRDGKKFYELMGWGSNQFCSSCFEEVE